MVAKIEETAKSAKMIEDLTALNASLKKQLDEHRQEAAKDRVALQELARKAEFTHHKLGYELAKEESRLQIEQLTSEIGKLNSEISTLKE